MQSDENEKSLTSVATALQNFFEGGRSSLSQGFQCYRLQRQWTQVVGREMGSLTRPVNYNKSVLVIAVKNASLLTELQFFREEILSRVNNHLNQLWARKIRFIVD